MSEVKKIGTTAASQLAPDLDITEPVASIVAAFATREAATVEEIVELTTRLTLLTSTSLALPRNLPEKNPEPSANPSGRKVPDHPALGIENAVTDDKVFCLCCGRGFTMLKRHLKAEHGLTEEDYRARFGLPDDFPLVAPNYSERKAAYAKEVGLGKYRREQSSLSTR